MITSLWTYGDILRRTLTSDCLCLHHGSQLHLGSVIQIPQASIFLAEQIKLLTGHTASPQFLSKLTWIALNHHSAIQHIDTVRAFHFGNNFLVEVDIILPEDMPLKEAHDIGEELQHRLESLSEVERAFVHLDYEYDHNPRAEHKMV